MCESEQEREVRSLEDDRFQVGGAHETGLAGHLRAENTSQWLLTCSLRMVTLLLVGLEIGGAREGKRDQQAGRQADGALCTYLLAAI